MIRLIILSIITTLSLTVSASDPNCDTIQDLESKKSDTESLEKVAAFEYYGKTNLANGEIPAHVNFYNDLGVYQFSKIITLKDTSALTAGGYWSEVLRFGELGPELIQTIRTCIDEKGRHTYYRGEKISLGKDRYTILN